MGLRSFTSIASVVALISLSLSLLGAFNASGRAYARSSWIKPGVSIEFQGNCTRYYLQMGQVNFVSKIANVSWSVEGIEGDLVIIRQRVLPLGEGGVLENLFEVDAESRLILSIDGEKPLNETYAYFWVETSLQSGDLVKVEDMVFVVEPGEPLTVSEALRETWVLRANITGPSANGTVVRWYDRETGIQLRAELNITIEIGGEPTLITALVEAKRTNIFGASEGTPLIADMEKERSSLESFFKASLAAAAIFIGRRVLTGK